MKKPKLSSTILWCGPIYNALEEPFFPYIRSIEDEMIKDVRTKVGENSIV